MSCTDDDLNALANGDASKFTMRHAAGEILNLRKSIADSTSKLAVVNKALDDIRLACCYGLEEDIDAQEAMLREIIKYARDAMEAAK